MGVSMKWFWHFSVIVIQCCCFLVLCLYSIVCLDVIVCNVLNCFSPLFAKHLGQRLLYDVCYIIKIKNKNP